MSFLYCHNTSRTQCDGFTLTEVMIVISIMLLLVVSAVPIFGRLHTFSQTHNAEDQIRQTLHIARQQSFSGQGEVAHGVKFLAHDIILFRGNSYATRQSGYDRDIDLGEVFTLSTTLTDDEVVFSKGLARPSETGTISISHGAGGQKSVEIKSFGVVD